MNIKLNKISSVLYNKSLMSTRSTAMLSAALVAMLSTSTFAAEENQEQQASADNEFEVIEVRGILGSLKAASLIKRTDGRVVDA
ncbi:hypothetical protein ACKI2C_51205, partial [Streptomyces brasiliscabiei]|uniref:hypothetical protein n=1 Tax=Streptomyces brasiliscabiei TaxID=2736302 RepID=UPI0038F7AE7E